MAEMRQRRAIITGMAAVGLLAAALLILSSANTVSNESAAASTATPGESLAALPTQPSAASAVSPAATQPPPRSTLAYAQCQNEWNERNDAPDVSGRARAALAGTGIPGITVGLAWGVGEDCFDPATMLFDHFWAYEVTLPVFIRVDGDTLADDAALGDLTARLLLALRDAGIPNPASTLVLLFSDGQAERRLSFAQQDGERARRQYQGGAALWAALESVS